MAIYDGVVTLADQEVPVIVELADDHVRMSASGTEIGNWPADECEITHVEDMVYAITAENETLQFVPNQPSLFAAAINGTSETSAGDMPPATVPERLEPVESAEPTSTQREAPPPKPLTMGLFYALCLVTAVLAGWALISIIF